MISRRKFLSGAALTTAAAAGPLGSTGGAPLAAAAVAQAAGRQPRYKIAAGFRRIQVSYDDGKRWYRSLTLPATAQIYDLKRDSGEDRLIVANGPHRFSLRSVDGARWWSLADDAPLPRTGDGGNWIAQIAPVGFNFAPRDWALCNGQLLSITQYQSLYSLIGTIYGGDGSETFALPDLRGRTALHFGTGPGLSNRTIGARSGSETNTLTVAQLPAHSHTATSQAAAASGRGTSDDPNGRTWAADGAYASYGYSSVAPSQPLHSAAVSTTVGMTGSGHAVNNMQPYLTINYVIALFGIFPSLP